MNRYYKTGRLAAALLWVGVVFAQQQPQTAPATPQLLHPMFQDHAVLHRDRPIKVYGVNYLSARSLAVAAGAYGVVDQSRARDLF